MTDEPLHYQHSCRDCETSWTDTYQYSVCPDCGEEDIEEIAIEEWEEMEAAQDAEPEWYPEDDEDYPHEQEHNELVE